MKNRIKITIIFSLLILGIMFSSSPFHTFAHAEQLVQEKNILEWKGSGGHLQGLTKPNVLVIKDEDTWNKVYRTIKGGQSGIFSLQTPIIDFKKFMIVGVFRGHSGGGDGIGILKTESMDGTEMMEFKYGMNTKTLALIKQKIFAVVYEITSPRPGSSVPAVVTAPFHLKVVRKSDLPVVFVKYIRTP